MRKPNPKTHQACRSLLQKAVRRGDASLTRKIALHLDEIGDADWLKTRTSVITFEECWPLGNNLHLTVGFGAIVDMLVRVTLAVKVKDAAGLGVLAYEFSKGDSSVLLNDREDRHIQRLSEAIKYPQKFWSWTTQKCFCDDQKLLLESSLKAYRRGGWPWDRALIQAAAYLAVTEGVPSVRTAERAQEEVPFWVGLDKHTPQGKQAFQDVAKQVGVTARQLSWVSFYFESARVNEGIESYWWSRECQWRLSQVGLSHGMARIIWDKARPILIKVLKEKTESLRMHLDGSIESEVSGESLMHPKTQQSRLPGF